MAVSSTRRATQLLNKYGWDVEYFKGFILGLVWLGLYREDSRYEAFLDLEAGALSDEESTLLEQYASALVQDIELERYRFSSGCQVSLTSFDENYKRENKLFQWASGIYMACRIVEVMTEDGDMTPSEADIYLMDRISESVFPFLDKKFAQEFFSEINTEPVDPEECIALLVRLRKNLPQIIRDITHSSQMLDDIPDENSELEEPLAFSGPVGNIHGYFAGMTDTWAINDTIDRLLPAVMAGSKQQRVMQIKVLLAYAEKALGDDFIKENTGIFWGVIETRCYMRVLTALGEAYKSSFQRDLAIDCYERCLELCHQDNLGARYLLAELYLEMHRVNDAIRLIKRFEFDSSAMLRFTLVVALYMKHGESSQARKALRDAMDSNIHIVPFLLGELQVPDELPSYYAPGDDGEAAIYVRGNQLLWRNTSGLIEWLKREVSSQ